jgi:hypothetical protein
MKMTFRESINALTDSNSPQSPTDLIFIYGGLIAIDLWIYATIAQVTIPHFDAMLLFLVGCKGVKIGKAYMVNKTQPQPKEETKTE